MRNILPTGLLLTCLLLASCSRLNQSEAWSEPSSYIDDYEVSKDGRTTAILSPLTPFNRRSGGVSDWKITLEYSDNNEPSLLMSGNAENMPRNMEVDFVGEYIYILRRADFNFEIIQYTLDDLSEKNLGRFDYESMSLSPTGQTLALWKRENYDSLNLEIYLLDLAEPSKSKSITIESPRAIRFINGIEWSTSDDAFMVLLNVEDNSDNYIIYDFEYEESTRFGRNLTLRNGTDYSFSWSSNQELIAVSSHKGISIYSIKHECLVTSFDERNSPSKPQWVSETSNLIYIRDFGSRRNEYQLMVKEIAVTDCR